MMDTLADTDSDPQCLEAASVNSLDSTQDLIRGGREEEEEKRRDDSFPVPPQMTQAL